MQYILNETEFQAFQALKEENAKLSHELVSKNAELVNLSSQVQSLIKKNQTYCKQIAEMKRDCEGISRALKEAQKIDDERFASINELVLEVLRLRNEHVCVAQNPKTSTVRVISASKADIYRQRGWTVSDELIVDRPA